MLDDLDIYIEDFYKSEKTNLKDLGIKVFRSTQVTLRNIDKKLMYREITIGQLPITRSAKDKQGANKKTVARQTLQAGDVLISARSRLGKVGLIQDRDLKDNIPTVAMNGMIIIRSGSEELGYFIKSYLESSKVQESVNNDPRTIQKGKRVITTDIILELPFPKIIENDFSTLKEYNEFFDSIRTQSIGLQAKISILCNLHLSKLSSQEITNTDSHIPNEWREIKDAQNKVSTLVDSMAEKLGIKDKSPYCNIRKE